MNMFKAVKATNSKEYIEQLSEPRKTEIKRIDEFIRKAVPKLKPVFLYNMLSYGKYRYKSSSGREGEWSVVSLASQKNYISVYVCALIGDKYIAETYKDKLPKSSIGKSCIRFKKFEDIDFDILKEILQKAEKSQWLGAVE